MGFLFGSKQSAPQPAPVPESPTVSTDAAAQRQAATDAAIAQSTASGRQRTIVAGQQIAQSDQDSLMAKRKSASTSILGG